MNKTIEYRLNKGTPESWKLPQKSVFVKRFVEENNQKKSIGFRRIVYMEGVDTMFAEDIKGDIIPYPITFIKGSFFARAGDELLNTYLQAHGWYGSHYKIYDEDEINKEELQSLKTAGNARRLVEDSDPERRKAIALVLFKNVALDWTDDTVELELLKYANTKPMKLQKEMEEGDWESKYISALAFTKGVVKENSLKTAIVWNDEEEGVILKLVAGQNAVKEFGVHLSQSSEDALLLLQTIGQKIESIDTNTPVISEKDRLLSEKDAEIEKLKAQLAKGSKLPKDDVKKGDEGDDKLLEAQNKYEELYNKKVPFAYKNKLDWLNKKIQEKS